MVNEGRVFSNEKVLELIAELGVELVKIDMTGSEQVYTDDLARADRKNIPVNLLYPVDYPNSPAILLEEVIGPADAIEALQRIQPATGPVQSAVVH